MLASVMEDYASDYNSNTHEGSDQMDQTNHALSLKLQVLRWHQLSKLNLNAIIDRYIWPNRLVACIFNPAEKYLIGLIKRIASSTNTCSKKLWAKKSLVGRRILYVQRQFYVYVLSEIADLIHVVLISIHMANLFSNPVYPRLKARLTIRSQ